MNPKNELPAFRVLVNDRAVMYFDARNLLQAADALYLEASDFDERVRDCEEIAEHEIQEFVMAEAIRLVQAGTRVAGPKLSLEIFIKEHGYVALLGALKQYQEAHKEALISYIPDEQDAAAIPEDEAGEASESVDVPV